MLPKCIQEPAQDQNLAEGGSKGGAETQSKNRRLLSTLSLLCSVMPVTLKLPFWSAPAGSTCKYKLWSISKVSPITTYCHPPLRRELRAGWWLWPQKPVHQKISAGKKRWSWKERCTPDPAIFVTFSLILSWWRLWSEWYKCGLTAREPEGLAVSWLSLTFFLSKNIPALGITLLWHSHLSRKLPFPYLFHIHNKLASKKKKNNKKNTDFCGFTVLKLSTSGRST